jgi:hypothetical protein
MRVLGGGCEGYETKEVGSRNVGCPDRWARVDLLNRFRSGLDRGTLGDGVWLFGYPAPECV